MSATEAASPQEEHRFPCERCGADYRFDPASGRLKCDFCGDEQPVGQRGPWSGGALREMDFRAALERLLPEAETEEPHVVACPNCAAVFSFDPDIHAAECPFCATPVVADSGTRRQIRPRGVLPFALDERAARKAMTDWLGRLWFAPGGLQAYARKGRRMQGVYIPFWTFDARTESTYSGERGIVRHETRTVTRNGRRVRVRVPKVRWHPVSGRVARIFDDVLVPASHSLPEADAAALEPWDLSALEPYQPRYLAGFRAEAYTVGLEEGFERARDHMDRVIARDVRFDIGGDQQRIHRIDTDVSDVTFKHILLPVWLAAYRYRGRSYRFVVNGRSGRVHGERPWSAIKIALAVAAGLAVAAIIGFLAASQG